jgi:small-conductance mechanosensitive channel
MTQLLQKFDRILLNNSAQDWLIAFGVAIAIVVVVALAVRVAIRLLRRFAPRTSTHLDEALLSVLQATRLWLVAVVALCIGSQYLELPRKLDLVFDRALTIALFVQAGLWVWTLIEFRLKRSRELALKHDPGSATSLGALAFIARVVLWTLVLLMILDNLGVNVTTLIAGLGVGGIAVALAVQSILGDLFASLSIVIDKPFVIGDFIIVGEYMGTIENVGLKTTRIRSLGGEQIVFSNGDLLKTRIRNYKRMRERRVLFTLGVLYQTPVEKVEKIPQLVRAIIEAHKEVRFERAHFKGFGDSSLDFEVVYWMLDPDFNLYMDIQQSINLALLRAFEREGVGFAYPTRTLVIDGPVRFEPAPETAEMQGGQSRSVARAQPG